MLHILNLIFVHAGYPFYPQLTHTSTMLIYKHKNNTTLLHFDVKATYSLGRSFSYLKKYLLKSIDAEIKNSPALKTMALCWLFCKRAFSVSGKFRQTLTDLIKTKHNSNQKITQITLDREKIQEYTYYLLGFVPPDTIRLKKDAWFSKLDLEQMKSIEHALACRCLIYRFS